MEPTRQRQKSEKGGGDGEGVQGRSSKSPAPSSRRPVWSTPRQADGNSTVPRTRFGWFPRVGRTVPRCRLSRCDVPGRGGQTAPWIYAVRVCSPRNQTRLLFFAFQTRMLGLELAQITIITCSPTDLYQMEIWYCKFSLASD